ncbi:cAMP-binding domain of CRP or a regulatory subunit of cAMP-dependent protein kinases [Roseovarius litoreus]|uniref:cAMP-binding domain of CRP or a regulatory subunit of cAMP-dependent protein kinases n=1 Tax=Roseovarius litoreus TaxID=1155722 RepID=A0A1M7D7X5_9RHOB|nr:Crp/Fnr family transcriptional regulator [Roseovarius litoreus]SHL75565.1 cAMP-binding domain of CRP or a regulatory subunit of cAMP-dependent protein kinases [Roseovarius litoreus]
MTAIGLTQRSGTGDEPVTGDPMRRSFATGAQIAVEGGPSFHAICVESGWLGLSKTMKDGKTLIVDLLMPGDAARLRMAGAERALCDLRSLTQSHVICIPEPHDIAARLPGLTERLKASEHAARARWAERMPRLGWAAADRRIAYLLVELALRAEAAGLASSPVRHLSLPLTQAQLGEMAGLSAVHVCRTLQALCAEGLIGGTFLPGLDVPSLPDLAARAGTEIDDLRRMIIPEDRSE